MKILVAARPGAKENRVEQVDATNFIVSVKEPPIKGKANAAIARELAAYFSVATAAVRLVSGFSAKKKVFEILNN